jgi:hypothetical protein
MPAEQRPWRHQEEAPLWPRQVNRCGGQQCSISHPERRSRDLPAEDGQLVSKHEELDVFHIQAASATNERAQQRPDGEVEEGEGHAADPPSPLAVRRRHRYWRPSPLFKPAGRNSPARVFADVTRATTGSCDVFVLVS